MIIYTAYSEEDILVPLLCSPPPYNDNNYIGTYLKIHHNPVTNVRIFPSVTVIPVGENNDVSPTLLSLDQNTGF